MHWIMLLWWPPIIILCPCQMTKSILFHESFLPSHSLVYPNSDLGKYWCITSKSYGGLLSPVCLYFVMFLQCHLFCFLLMSQPGIYLLVQKYIQISVGIQYRLSNKHKTSLHVYLWRLGMVLSSFNIRQKSFTYIVFSSSPLFKVH